MVGIRQRDGVLQSLTRSRTTAGRRPGGKNPRNEVNPPAFYVRLDRKGDEFRFFSSTDGTNWEDLEGRWRLGLAPRKCATCWPHSVLRSTRSGCDASR